MPKDFLMALLHDTLTRSTETEVRAVASAIGNHVPYGDWWLVGSILGLDGVPARDSEKVKADARRS